MRLADKDNNGFINYIEFIDASIDHEKILSNERLMSVFNDFDI